MVTLFKEYKVQKVSLGVYTYGFHFAYPFLIVCYIQVTGVVGLAQLPGVKKLLLQALALQRGRFNIKTGST